MFCPKPPTDSSRILSFRAVDISPVSVLSTSCFEKLCFLEVPVIDGTEFNTDSIYLRPKFICAPIAAPTEFPSVPPSAAVTVPKVDCPSRFPQAQSTNEILTGKVKVLGLGTDKV